VRAYIDDLLPDIIEVRIEPGRVFEDPQAPGPPPSADPMVGPISGSPMVDAKTALSAINSPRVIPKLDRFQKVGGGGQGRNRTIHPRIFSTTESPVRCE
jgi:hypothetical protein